MNKKLTSLLLSALTLGALSAQAQTPEPAPAPVSAYSIATDFTYTTKYVFRGVELAKGAFQPSVKLTSGDFYLGVWTSLPANRGYEAEVDFFGGYGFKLGGDWSLDVGATLYYYPGLDTSTGLDKSTFEGYVGLNGKLGVLTTGTYLYYDFTLEAFTIQEALGYSIEVSKTTSVNITATLGRVEPDAGSGYTYYGVGVAVPFKLSDSTTLTVGAQYADHNIMGLEGNHFWGTLGLTFTF